ncbi:MAG: CPBP family intramembrane metalloprotease [bacterium]|nr:CPBP family intramembrane metalloprotease [bacterium]
MKKILNRSGWIYFSFFVLSMLLQMGLALCVRDSGWLTEENRSTLSVLLSAFVMYGLCFWLSALCFRFLPKGEGGIEEERWGIGKTLLYFLVCLAVMYLGNIIGNVLIFMVSTFLGREMPENEMANVVMSADIWAIFLVTVILAPMVEEWMFRKFLLDRIAVYGQGRAALLSAVLFGLAHGNFYQFFYAFGLGLLLAYVYMKTGKIRYSIGFHMGINFMGGVVAPALLSWQMHAAESPYVLERLLPSLCLLAYSCLLLGCMVAGIVLICCNLQKIRLQPAKEKLPQGGVILALLCSPGIWAYGLYCLIQFADSLLV